MQGIKARPVPKKTCTIVHLAIIQNGAEKGMKERGKNADVQRNVPSQFLSESTGSEFKESEE
jgi:hypothetical protein